MNLCPKVTVLVPVYNVERYLRQCLESLRAQTLHEMEVILLDDGSTDGCAAICDEFVERDARFRAIHKPNSGYGATMNVGLREARGEYIGIVESDDWVEPEMFEEMYSLAKQHQVPVVKSNLFQYHANGESRLLELIPPQDADQRLCPAQRSSIFYQMPSIWAALYQREFLLKNGIMFLETPGASYQDTSFNFKVWARAQSIFLTSRAFYHYRVDNVDSSVKSSEKIFCVVDEWHEIERYMKQYPEDERASFPLRLHLKWGTYMWNWNRLNAAGRAAFEPIIRKEFERFKNRFFCLDFHRRREWRDFLLIMGNHSFKTRFMLSINDLIRHIYKCKAYDGIIVYRIFFGLFRIRRKLHPWDTIPTFSGVQVPNASTSPSKAPSDNSHFA